MRGKERKVEERGGEKRCEEWSREEERRDVRGKERRDVKRIEMVWVSSGDEVGWGSME